MNNKPNYITRPSKHVERKIFVEVLQALSRYKYDIPNYKYIGFGSYYYADFVLFNKHLSINDMVCLEREKKFKGRMKFNKPYDFINLKMKKFSEYVSSVKNNKEHLVWLDYEERLNKKVIDPLKTLVHSLKNGSILIITVNVDLKDMRNVEFIEGDYAEEIIKKQKESLKEKCQNDFFPFGGVIKTNDTTPNKYPELCIRTILSVIKSGLSGRVNDRFYQLFNYVYQDGTRMLTFGGIIDKKNKAREIYSALESTKHINKSKKPLKISIPPLTVREKLFLDQKIQNNKILKGEVPFEIDREHLKDYCKCSKHYPMFYEVLMG